MLCSCYCISNDDQVQETIPISGRPGSQLELCPAVIYALCHTSRPTECAEAQRSSFTGLIDFHISQWQVVLCTVAVDDRGGGAAHHQRRGGCRARVTVAQSLHVEAQGLFRLYFGYVKFASSE